MDMNLSFLDAVPARPRRLDYRALVAAVADAHGGSDRPAAPCAHASQLENAPANLRLAAVLLGRDDWRQAARVLGGGFVPSGGCKPL